MSAMSRNSVYVVHRQILGLADHPFPLKKDIRPIWQPIFCNKNCFTDNLSLITESNTRVKNILDKEERAKRGWHIGNIPCHSTPFVPYLGPCCFTIRGVHLRGAGSVAAGDIYRVIKHINGVKPYSLKVPDSLVTSEEVDDNRRIYNDANYDPEVFQEILKDHPDLNFFQLQYLHSQYLHETYLDSRPYFGYDPTLEDQRMNFLFFEIRNPLFIKAETQNDVQSYGRVFLHIYPSGYLVLHFAVTLQWQNERSLEDVRKMIQETRPWRTASHWKWSSKIGKGTLYQIIANVKKIIQRSIYTHTSANLREEQWQSTLKIVAAPDQGEQIASELLLVRGKFDVINIPLTEERLPCLLLSSKQGITFVGHPDYKSKKNSHHFFWRKLLVLSEFVAYKDRIYQDYEALLRPQISSLKEYRLSTLRKLEEENIFKLSVYDSTTTRFLTTLDNYIRFASPFHRRLYSSISYGTDFDSHRKSLMELLDKWEGEISKWEPGLVTLWKKVVSPLRSILKLPL